MISIIIPVYNQADKLAKCLSSISAQTYQDYEVIVVNDGSIDDPEVICRPYKALLNDKMTYISQNNQGSNPARNRGAVEAKGEYLIFCDADIVMEAKMLATLLKALENNPSKAYSYPKFKFGFKTFNPGEFDASKLRQAPLIHTTALIKKNIFPGFDNTIKRFQDWDLWLTILEQGGEGVFVDELLFSVETGGTMSNWLPSFAYKLIPWLPEVKKYQRAMDIIKNKHRNTISNSQFPISKQISNHNN